MHNNNFNHLIDPTFYLNQSFVLIFEKLADRISFSNYCLPTVVKNHNVMINGRRLFDQSAKNIKKT